jgi:hypothetical protein
MSFVLLFLLYWQQNLSVQGLFQDFDRKAILEFNNLLADGFDSFRLADGSEIPPFAYVLGDVSENSSLYYLQFTKECDDRIRFPDYAFSMLWNASDVNATYSVSPTTIKPSADTIDVDGPWIDKSENFK